MADKNASEPGAGCDRAYKSVVSRQWTAFALAVGLIVVPVIVDFSGSFHKVAFQGVTDTEADVVTAQPAEIDECQQDIEPLPGPAEAVAETGGATDTTELSEVDSELPAELSESVESQGLFIRRANNCVALIRTDSKSVVGTQIASLTTDVESTDGNESTDVVLAAVPGDSPTQRRLWIGASPYSLREKWLGHLVFASAAEWAAGMKPSDASWTVLLVPQAAATQEQRQDLRAILQSFFSGLDWTIDVVDVEEGGYRPSVAYEALFVANWDGLPPDLDPETITKVPVITWTPEVWVRANHPELIGLEAGNEAIDSAVESDFYWTEAAGQQFKFTAPGHRAIGGVIGQQPDVTKHVNQARSALIVFAILAIAFVWTALAASKAFGEYVANIEADSDALPEALKASAVYMKEQTDARNKALVPLHWWFLGLVVVVSVTSWYILSSDPDAINWPHFFFDWSPGAAWAAFGILIVLTASDLFGILAMKAFRRVVDQSSAGSSLARREQFDPAGLGICLSGGGIRAAAFGLGGLEALQSRGVVERASHLTAVSGGAYIAAAYTAVRQVKKKPFEIDSPELIHLRNNTHYLAPGLFGKARVFAEWLTGLAANLLLVGAVVWMAAVAAGVLVKSHLFLPQLAHVPQVLADQVPRVNWPWWQPWVGETLAILGLIAGVHMVASWVLNEESKSVNVRTVIGALAALATLLLILGGIPQALRVAQSVADAISASPAIAQAISGVLAIGWVAAIVRGLFAGWGSRVAQALAGLFVPIGLLALFIWFGWITVTLSEGWLWLLTAVALLVIAWMAFRFSSRRSTFHDFYRDRLKVAFAKYGTRRMRSLKKGPALTICAVANLGPGPVTPPGRAALPWVFERTRVGLESDGSDRPVTVSDEAMAGLYQKSKKKRPSIEIFDAVAISGAAVSPSMGRRTLPPFRALLAILNIRLGSWLPNPMFKDIWGENRHCESFSRKPRQFPRLFKEMLGRHSPADTHLYVTDGGHYDNLGLVSLIRQQCETIVCFDASADGTIGFSTIADAIMLSDAELGCSISFDPRPEMMPVDEGADWPVAEKAVQGATITYASGGKGRLIYCRASMAEDTPWSIESFRRRNKTFPNTSTGVQLFSDEMFENYRALGQYVGEQALRFLGAPWK